MTDCQPAKIKPVLAVCGSIIATLQPPLPLKHRRCATGDSCGSPPLLLDGNHHHRRRCRRRPRRFFRRGLDSRLRPHARLVLDILENIAGLRTGRRRRRRAAHRLVHHALRRVQHGALREVIESLRARRAVLLVTCGLSPGVEETVTQLRSTALLQRNGRSRNYPVARGSKRQRTAPQRDSEDEGEAGSEAGCEGSSPVSCSCGARWIQATGWDGRKRQRCRGHQHGGGHAC